MNTTTHKPIPLVELKMEMVRRGLSLREVATRSGVPYASASAILAGRLLQPENLEKIEKAIESAPVPEFAPAA